MYLSHRENTVRSPCTGVCTYAETTKEDIERICRGCGRTAEEIEDWYTATDTRKNEIIKAAEARKK
jgi:predicted Fe-S protein YdhL (DUF1289 family)